VVPALAVELLLSGTIVVSSPVLRATAASIPELLPRCLQVLVLHRLLLILLYHPVESLGFRDTKVGFSLLHA